MVRERIEDIYYKEGKSGEVTWEEVAEIEAFVDKKNPLSLYNNETKSTVPLTVKKAIKLVTKRSLYSDFLESSTLQKIADLDMVATRCIFNDRFLARAEEKAQFYFDHIKMLILNKNFTKL